MTKRPSLSCQTTLARMEHAAWVLPSARGPWAKAMQNEFLQIENDLEALNRAGAACSSATLREAVRLPALLQERF